MSHCWCKCEAGLGQCGPKVPKLKSLFNAHKNLDEGSLRRGDRQAELQLIWEDVGEDKMVRTEELRQQVADAVDRAYDKALEEAVRKRTAMEESVVAAEQRLRDLLGPDAAGAIAPRALPLQERLDVNLARLHEIDTQRIGGFGWVGGLVVLAELRRRIMALRSTLKLPAPDESADITQVLLSTLEAVPNKPKVLGPSPSQKLNASFGANKATEQKPMFQRLETFYATLCTMENAWAESFASKGHHGDDGSDQDLSDDEGEMHEGVAEQLVKMTLQDMEQQRAIKNRQRRIRRTLSTTSSSSSLTPIVRATSDSPRQRPDSPHQRQQPPSPRSSSPLRLRTPRSPFGSGGSGGGWGERGERNSPLQVEASMSPASSPRAAALMSPLVLSDPPGSKSKKSKSKIFSRSSSVERGEASSIEELSARIFQKLDRIHEQTAGHKPTEEELGRSKGRGTAVVFDSLGNTGSGSTDDLNSIYEPPTFYAPPSASTTPAPSRALGQSAAPMKPRVTVNAGAVPLFWPPPNLLQVKDLDLKVVGPRSDRFDSLHSLADIINMSRDSRAAVRAASAAKKAAAASENIPPRSLLMHGAHLSSSAAAARTNLAPSATAGVTGWGSTFHQTMPLSLLQPKASELQPQPQPPATAAPDAKQASENSPVLLMPPPFALSSDRTSSKPTTTSAASTKVPPPPPPPPPPPTAAKPGGPPPPPPPPPPPSSKLRGGRVADQEKKLKRSTKMGHLYRGLKVRAERAAAGVVVEGSILESLEAAANVVLPGVGFSRESSMADALQEISRKSAYFKAIEDDVATYAADIWQAKSELESFQSSSMEEVVVFHRRIEALLEPLTDESQVLARFEGFPSSKLESIRLAASLHSRLKSIESEIATWRFSPHLSGSNELQRLTAFFERMRKEVEAVERSKDEDSKRFSSQKIHFSFASVDRIKEGMVCLSSQMLELALSESMKLRASVELVNGAIPQQAMPRVRAALSLLWSSFQFSFKVYTFAGGQDENAEQLALALATEMEAYPPSAWA